MISNLWHCRVHDRHLARILTLAQWTGAAHGGWTCRTAARATLSIWITRGQGRLPWSRASVAGVGVHNALAIPANTCFRWTLASQGFGLVCLSRLWPCSDARRTAASAHPRCAGAKRTDLDPRRHAARTERARPFVDEALNAEATLLTVWLRRAMIEHGEEPEKDNRGTTACDGLLRLVERDHTTGRPMADYAQRARGDPHASHTHSCRECTGMTAAETADQAQSARRA